MGEIDFSALIDWIDGQWWAPIYYFVGLVIVLGMVLLLIVQNYKEKTLMKNIKEGIVVIIKVCFIYFPLIFIVCLAVIIPFVLVLVFVFGG